ncbi:DUF1761 domain-containing protein, partial [Borreliella americana]|nr:DUF1761 domain-containing protein [Borreliella americana]
MLIKIMFSNINLILIVSMTLFKILLEIIYRKILFKKIITGADTLNIQKKQYKTIIIFV